MESFSKDMYSLKSYSFYQLGSTIEMIENIAIEEIIETLFTI